MFRQSKHLVIRCNVKHCRSSSMELSTSLFHLPRANDVCMEWIRLSGEDKLLHSAPDFVLNHLHICEKHFLPSDIVLESENNSSKRLKTGSIPCIFQPHHRPIPKAALLHWLRQYPEAELKPPIGLEDDPFAFDNSCDSESVLQQTEQVWIQDSSQGFMENLSTIKEEPVSSDQEDESDLKQDQDIGGPTPSVPLMQMLLNAHLAKSSNDSEGQEPMKLVVPVSNPEFSEQDGSRKFFFLQVEKLPKKPSESQLIPTASSIESPLIKEEIIEEEDLKVEESKSGTSKKFLKANVDTLREVPWISDSSLPRAEALPGRIPHLSQLDTPSNKVLLLQVKKLLKKPPSSTTNHRLNDQLTSILPPVSTTSAIQRNTVVNLHRGKEREPFVQTTLIPPAKSVESHLGLPVGLGPNIQLGKRNIEERHTNHLQPKFPMQPNQQDAERRVIFLQVEKLPKSSNNISTNCNELKINEAPAKGKCRVNSNINVQLEVSSTCNSPADHCKEALTDVVSPRVSVIHPCDTSKSLLTGADNKNISVENFTKEEFSIPQVQRKFKKFQTCALEGQRKRSRQSLKIKRLEKRVQCLETMLLNLLGEKLVPPPLHEIIKNALKGTAKLKKRSY